MAILKRLRKKRKKVKEFLKNLLRMKKKNYMRMIFNYAQKKKNELEEIV